MLCGCGCNQPSGVYSYSDSRTGVMKGQPRRFLPGHNSSGVKKEEAKAREQRPHLCLCGCQRPSGFYLKTSRANGQIKGAPRRFLPGHSLHAPQKPKSKCFATKVDWGRFVPPGSLAQRDKVPPGCPLSNREYEVMQYVSRGYTYKEIASELQLGVSTIRSHMHRIFVALDVVGRGQNAAVVLMKDMGWFGTVPTEQKSTTEDALSPHELVYCIAFTRLVLERTPHCTHMVTLAYMSLCMNRNWKPARRRSTPDIDEWLLRMARGLMRPILID